MNMKTDLSNLLTASSILLGVITALYGLFYPSILFVLETKTKTHSVDNKQSYNKSKSIVKTKYYPLLFGSIIITLLYLPELCFQIKSSIDAIAKNGWKNTTYNTSIATFIVVCLFFIFFSIKIITIGIKLRKKINALNPNVEKK